MIWSRRWVDATLGRCALSAGESNNMKPLLFILFLAASCSPCIAQKEWELRLGGGYNFSTASQYILDQVSATSTNINSRSVNSSFGRGVGFNADATCWMNRYFGITAGAGYQVTTPPVKGSYN